MPGCGAFHFSSERGKRVGRRAYLPPRTMAACTTSRSGISPRGLRFSTRRADGTIRRSRHWWRSSRVKSSSVPSVGGISNPGVGNWRPRWTNRKCWSWNLGPRGPGSHAGRRIGSAPRGQLRRGAERRGRSDELGWDMQPHASSASREGRNSKHDTTGKTVPASAIPPENRREEGVKHETPPSARRPGMTDPKVDNGRPGQKTEDQRGLHR